MIISKVKTDPNGLEFELAMFKAMYIYPKPDREDCQDVMSHAMNIYEGENLNRSLCENYSELFKPITYVTTKLYLNDPKWFKYNTRNIRKKRNRLIDGVWESYEDSRDVKEHVYQFQDVIHLGKVNSVIELKKYENDAGRKRHLDNIRAKSWDCDYFFIAKEEEDHFEITDFLSLNRNKQFVRHEASEFFT